MSVMTGNNLAHQPDSSRCGGAEISPPKSFGGLVSLTLEADYLEFCSPGPATYERARREKATMESIKAASASRTAMTAATSV